MQWAFPGRPLRECGVVANSSATRRTEQKGLLLFCQTGIYLADNVEVTVVVPQLASRDGMLAVENVVVTVTIADLGRIGNALIKLGSDALDTAIRN